MANWVYKHDNTQEHKKRMSIADTKLNQWRNQMAAKVWMRKTIPRETVEKLEIKITSSDQSLQNLFRRAFLLWICLNQDNTQLLKKLYLRNYLKTYVTVTN